MNAFKISWLLFKNNLKLYKFYLAVLVLTTAIYYNFLAVNYNPYLQVLGEQYVYARAASMLCSMILFLTVLSFMAHANNFFYKLRYKEVGTYMLMGIPSSKIGTVFAIESMLLGGTALLIGLPAGLLFSKLFFMLLGKAMILNIQIPFYIPMKAVVILILILAGLIIFMGLNNYRLVRRSKLIDILNAAKQEQRMPQLRFIRGLLGVAAIATAYYLALNILRLDMNFLTASVLILVLVCSGTYLFFGSFLAIILNALIRNKKIIYRGSRLVSFSNTLFRLGTHYRSLSMAAILCAATLAAFGGSLALKSFADSNTIMEAPYSISYINQDEATGRQIKALIEDSGRRILAERQIRFISGEVTYDNGYGIRTEPCLIAGYSEVEESLKVTQPDHYPRLLPEIQPQEGETVSILHSNLAFSGGSLAGDNLVVQGKPLILKNEVKIPFVGEMPGIGQYQTYIVTDRQYAELKKNAKEMVLQGINISEPENSKDLVGKIARVMKNPAENLNSFAGQYEYKYYLIGAFYFVGLVMALVFMISTFSTMYFKILSDAILDRNQYKMLMQIGMSREEVAGSIYTQVGVAFILPALLGTLHGVMAVKALEAFMHSGFLGSILTGAGVFLVIMTGFYIFMSRKYRDMVIKGWERHENVLS